jgi:N-acetylglucosamine-6-sulfatase
LRKLMIVVIILGFAIFPAASMAPQQAEAATRPNILFILTDDLDSRGDARMDNLRRLMKRRGTTFKNAFVTTSQCCPSRASILTGQYVHNHTIFTNPGAARKFRSTREDRSTVATWLNRRGYKTIFIGKYLNGYRGTYIPPGWDRWEAQQAGSKHKLNVNGTIKSFDSQLHVTDLFSDRAVRYIRNGAGKGGPLFMYLSVNAPHSPDDGAPRHEKRYKDVRLPRPPNFNERDVSDKPAYIRNLSRLSRSDIRELTHRHRDRLRSMLTADDMIGRLISELRKSGELKETYIVFTSDNGYHLGQHRLKVGKGRAYEEDIRIPLYVRGPTVPAGRKLTHKVLNIDFAPTFAKLGEAQIPAATDGRSFVALLRKTAPPPADSWRESFLVEFFHSRTYKALRTGRYSYVEYDNGEKELYDLKADPYQLESLHHSQERQVLMDRFHTRLKALKNCSGQLSCKTAEGAAP